MCYAFSRYSYESFAATSWFPNADAHSNPDPKYSKIATIEARRCNDCLSKVIYYAAHIILSRFKKMDWARMGE